MPERNQTFGLKGGNYKKKKERKKKEQSTHTEVVYRGGLLLILVLEIRKLVNESSCGLLISDTCSVLWRMMPWTISDSTFSNKKSVALLAQIRLKSLLRANAVGVWRNAYPQSTDESYPVFFRRRKLVEARKRKTNGPQKKEKKSEGRSLHDIAPQSYGSREAGS
jgi:hypothetical protein